MDTIVFDFDGVIHRYNSGWQGATVIPDLPVTGIGDAIRDIRKDGYKVVVVSTRCSEPGGIEAISGWLLEHDIVVDDISAEKPPALMYIDDRAICFDGHAETLLEKIRKFEPWWWINPLKSKEGKNDICLPDYEKEYNRLMKENTVLSIENESLRRTLVEMCKSYFNTGGMY